MRNRYILVADLGLVVAAAFGAFVLRFDWFAYQHRAELFPFLAVALAVKPVVFYAFGMYRRYWVYASVKDLVALSLAASAASIGVGVAVALGLFTGHVAEFSRSVLLIDWALTLLGAGGFRMSIRILHDARSAGRQPAAAGGTVRRALIAGAGNAGAIVAREMQRNPRLEMVPVGFLDDDPMKIGKRIHGLPVLGPLSALPRRVRREGVDEVIIAMPTAPGSVLRAVAESCRRLGVPSRTVPGMFELIDGTISVSRLRHVEIADLLRRRLVMGAAGASEYLAGRTVLVTGAGGSIGRELCRQVALARPSLLVLLGHGENSIFETHAQLRASAPGLLLLPVIADVRDVERLGTVFDALRPAVVFHAAAHKHVPLMEENPEEAVTNNIIGTRNVVEAAVRCGAQRLVLVSTDKAVRPVSVMGASKHIAEAVVLSAARRHRRAFMVVRFGNVLGSRGSVVQVFKEQIERGGPITITHPDMKRYFMTISEAVNLVLQAAGMGSTGELFVLNMGKPVGIVDLANDLITLSGLSPGDVPIVFTGPRPGEKLEEALWDDRASIHPTAIPDILRVEEPAPFDTPVETIVDELAAAARRGDRPRLGTALARWVPTLSAPIDARPVAGPWRSP
jgi:FlaA1/EpsC-like NDP-sugar epimerase